VPITASRRDAQPPVVEIGARALLGPIEFVAGRLVDHCGDDFAVPFEPDRDAEMRDAVQEIGRAVERVDDPAMPLVAAFGGAAFLEQHRITGPRPAELALQRSLGLEVGG
jgi:hypothetical protein